LHTFNTDNASGNAVKFAWPSVIDFARALVFKLASLKSWTRLCW
jgi:hypothetical protein